MSNRAKNRNRSAFIGVPPRAWASVFLCVAWAVPALGQEVPANLARFMQRHCAECHGGDDAEAKLDLSRIAWRLDERPTFDRWVSILDRAAAGQMPPQSAEQPSAEDRSAFTRGLEPLLIEANKRRQTAAGRTTIRRLNNCEYERTVQDLLGISAPLAHLLPEETPLHGFDTVSDGLRFSALHVEKYLAAADAALDEAIRLGPPPEQHDKRFLLREQEGIRNNLPEKQSIARDIGNAVVLFADASYITKLHGIYISAAGRYRIRARGWAFQSERPVVLRLNAGNYGLGSTRILGFFDMPPGEASEVEVTVRLEEGEYLYPAPDDLVADAEGKNVWAGGGGKDYRGSGLALEWVEVEGPLEPDWPPASVARVFGETPVERLPQPQWRDGKQTAYAIRPKDAQAELPRVLRDFARRAFRRPIEPVEVFRYVQVAAEALEAGQSFEQAVRIGVRSILTSPQFLILHERPGRLDDYALAARLSYFLWSTAPDEELLQLAAQGKLANPDELRRQTERLLNDERSEAFVRSFVEQWLDLRRIDATSPDANLYPEFDELLKHSMLSESRAFFRELLERDLPVTNFADSDFALLNRRLAEHYGIEGVQGQEMRRVQLPEHSPRGGVLTQGAVLKVTANGTVTSPVTRGAWVMARLLNQPPAPPPPGVGSIEPDTRGATTIREQLDLHRRDPSCASCHAAIDPPGFALESFDVIGGWRDRYRSNDKGDRVETKLRGRGIWEYKLGPPVDSAGQLASGESFADVRGFKKLLAAEREQDIARAVATNLMIYATGQRIELSDRAVLEAIVADSEASGHGLRDLVHRVVQSELFQSK